MENSRIDAAGLFFALAAATLAFSAAQMNFGYWSSLSGLTLLLVLFAFDRQGYRSALQSLAFAAVCGVCGVLAAGYLLHIILSPTEPKADQAALDGRLSLAWLVVTAIFFGIDRARMGGREQLGLAIASPVARPVAQGFNVPYTPAPASAPPPVFTPAPVYSAPAPAPPPTFAPAPAYSAPIPVAQPVVEQTQPYIPPVPPVEFVPPPAAPVAPPAPHQIPPGKEVMIYVNLMGEGINVLRTVRAEHVGRDFYLIADEMPANEDWEFKPGQIVRCKKKNLSSGKGLVAFEEAPRAN